MAGSSLRAASVTAILSRLSLGILGCALISAWTTAARAADAAASPIGTWLTESGGADVQIADCGSKLCGSIVWIKEPLDAHGRPKVDSNNPDQALRSRKILGLVILSGFVSAGDNVWQDGLIYNPQDGRTYKCTLTLVDDHTLRVRGYVGISLLGKTQTWTRVDGVTTVPAGAQ
jgi:uncharacterized protein (DUF2147 family)